jgi:hypothetical protein
VSPRLGLPVGVDYGGLTTPDYVVVPVPGSGVYGLADTAEDAEGGQVVLRVEVIGGGEGGGDT